MAMRPANPWPTLSRLQTTPPATIDAHGVPCRRCVAARARGRNPPRAIENGMREVARSVLLSSAALLTVAPTSIRRPSAGPPRSVAAVVKYPSPQSLQEPTDPSAQAVSTMYPSTTQGTTINRAVG